MLRLIGMDYRNFPILTDSTGELASEEVTAKGGALLGSSALSAMQLTTPYLDEVDKRPKQKPLSRDICICGHSVNNHKDFGDGQLICTPAKQFCPCERLLPVIEVENTKYFLRRTRGYGEKHALTMGLHHLTKNGFWSRMLIEPICFRCEGTNLTIYPTPISRGNSVSYGPSPLNVFLCLDCIYQLQGIPVTK